MLKEKDIKECKKAYSEFKRIRNLNKEIPECPFDQDIILPMPPPAKEIANYGLPKKDRKFKYYNIKKLKEVIKDNPRAAKDIAKSEWDRRKNGYWFFNGDKLEYITGAHYMFLQYWTVEAKIKYEDGTVAKIPSQPTLIDMQRDWYYAWNYMEKDPNSFGMLFIGRRRTAKTEMAISEGYWHATSGKSKKFYIQSKSDGDGAAVLKRLVTSWQNLPYIWKPMDKGASDVRKVIEFREPTKRDSKSKQSGRTYEEVLNSEIGYKPSTDTALDGMYVSRILNDEVFKTPKKIADIKNRWEINKKCLIEGTDIIGKAILTSTVEEVEKDGLKHMIELLNESMPSAKNPVTGRTVSGLNAMFFPAYYGLQGEYKGKKLVDEWGYSNMELAKEYLEQERVGKKGTSLINEKRRNPFTIEEAFYIDGKHEIFSQEALRSQEKYNKSSGVYDKDIRRGNFYWIDGRKWGRVAWRDDPHGRWKRFIDSPSENRNRNRMMGSFKAPTGNSFFSGCDPVDHGRVRDGAGSMPVSHVIAMPNPLLGIDRKTLACQYAYRHHDPNLFYEDMVMQCVYYNCPFLAENQKKGVINYFEDKGFAGYCMYDPTEADPKRKFRGDRGLPTTGGKIRDYLIRLGQAYVNDNVGYFYETDSYGCLPFAELIEDLFDFNPAKWTPHDYVVSFLITLCATTQASTSITTVGNISSYLPNAKRR